MYPSPGIMVSPGAAVVTSGPGIVDIAIVSMFLVMAASAATSALRGADGDGDGYDAGELHMPGIGTAAPVAFGSCTDTNIACTDTNIGQGQALPQKQFYLLFMAAQSNWQHSPIVQQQELRA